MISSAHSGNLRQQGSNPLLHVSPMVAAANAPAFPIAAQNLSCTPVYSKAVGYEERSCVKWTVHDEGRRDHVAPSMAAFAIGWVAGIGLLK